MMMEDWSNRACRYTSLHLLILHFFFFQICIEFVIICVKNIYKVYTITINDKVICKQWEEKLVIALLSNVFCPSSC